jgi:hypothetical protein
MKFIFYARQQVGAAVGMRHRSGQSKTPTPERMLPLENRMLRSYLPARLLLSDAESRPWLEIGKRLGSRTFSWSPRSPSGHHPGLVPRLIAQQFDGSRRRCSFAMSVITGRSVCQITEARAAEAG